MPVVLPKWLSRGADATRRFAIERPWTLFLVLLAMNALARPVSVTAHDARLYSLQALNAAEHGAYAEDVFLRYGSQDQFSLFSRIVGPTVAQLGLRVAFFCWYFVFNTLFVLAMFRLVRALIDDALIATLALVFLVTAPLPYGGHDIFMVHEQFFTPRTIGTAITLFAVERFFKQHFSAAFVLSLVAAAVHPLMAFGGVMIGVGFWAATYLSQRVCLTLLAAASVLGVTVLGAPTLGTMLFGAMDDDWHQQIRLSVPYNYPDAWRLLDWLNVVVSLALPIAAVTTVFRDDPVRRRFFLVVSLAGAVGLLATCFASMSTYALLFQAQPYRVLWILKVLQIPLGFLLIAHWSQSASIYARIAALALVAFFCNTHALPPELTIMAAILPVSLLYAKITALTPDQDWRWYGAARGFVLGALGWMTYRLWFFAAHRSIFIHHFDLNEFVMFDVISPLFWIVGLCVFASWSPLQFRAVKWSAAMIAACAPVAFFMAEASPTFRVEHTRLGGDMAFVRDFVKNSAVKHPTIYAAFNRPDLLWIDVGANSYFDILQSAGVIFNRETAQEIARRALLVAPFEMQVYRDKDVFRNENAKASMEKLFGVPVTGAPATQEDLAALCQEPSLDYVVITQAFTGLYAATNGRVYVYDCAKVRSRCHGMSD